MSVEQQPPYTLQEALKNLIGSERQPTELSFEHVISLDSISQEIKDYFNNDPKLIAIAIGEIYGNLALDPLWWKSVRTSMLDQSSDTPNHPPKKGEVYFQKVFFTIASRIFGLPVARHRIEVMEIIQDKDAGYYIQKTTAKPRPKIPGATYGYDAYYTTYYDEETKSIVVGLKGMLNAGPLNRVLATEAFKRRAAKLMQPNFRDFEKLFQKGNIFESLQEVKYRSRRKRFSPRDVGGVVREG
jgi:hypothetical protein